MFIIIGWRSRNCDQVTGYMYCPSCGSRMPAAQGVRKTYLTTFFIPLVPIADGTGYYRCEGCQGMFDSDSDWPFDFGDHPSPKLWTCSFCHSSNPSHSYQCQSCGADA